MPSSKNKSKDKKKGPIEADKSKEPSEAVEATEAAFADKPGPSKEKPAAQEAKPAKEEKAEEKAEEKIQDQNEIIKEVLEKMGLSNEDMPVQEKLDALCLMFKQTITENVKLKDTLTNMAGQLEKNDMTKVALQKLCDALRTQVSLKDEENNLKLQEETQKRIDIAKNFETTMAELTKLIETHSNQNTTLRKENIDLATKLQDLLKDFEDREAKLDMIREEFRLKGQLYEAQIAKAKVEKAEVSADFNKERLEMQKQLIEAQKNVDILMTREENMKEQMEIYAAQCEAMSKGVNDKKTNIGTFKTQVDNLNKKLKGLEADTTMWKEKFEESNEIVVKMNAAKADSDRDLETTKKKLSAMEKLNRALQTERSDLLAQIKGGASKNGEEQNGNH